MKKLAAISILFFYSSVCYAQSVSFHKVRSLYQKAATERKACKELVKLLKHYNRKDNPILMGYKASATIMMAKHVFNPFRKLSYFNKGKNMLEKAIEADSESIELRFLRYAAQTNAPSFLGYDDHIEADKAVLHRSMKESVDTVLKNLSKPG